MITAPTYGLVTTLQMSIDEARTKVEAALKEEGFGVLTEIDVKTTLKNKIDVDFAPYQILGACNPGFAHKALTAQPNIGLLLPCNVVLHEVEEGTTRVSLIDPIQMLAMEGDNPELLAVAQHAADSFKRVHAALEA